METPPKIKSPTPPTQSQSPQRILQKQQLQLQLQQTSKPCTCTKYDPHLWRPICKTCYHAKSQHQQEGAGKCTHVGEALTHPKPLFLEQWTSRATIIEAQPQQITSPPTKPKAQLKNPNATAPVLTSSAKQQQQQQQQPNKIQIQQKELETLRDSVSTLNSLVGAEDLEATSPKALAEVFESIAKSLVASAGVQDEPFVKDFLSAFKISMSTQSLFASAGPLDPIAISHLKSVGRSVWWCWKQQSYLQTITHAQALLSTTILRTTSITNNPSRTPPLLTFLEKMKAFLASERSFCILLESDTNDLPSIISAMRHHRQLVIKLEEICTNYPSMQSWNIGSFMLNWIGEAIPVYSLLFRELSLAKKENKDQRASFLNSIVTRIAVYETILKQLPEYFQTLSIAITTTNKTLVLGMDKTVIDNELIEINKAIIASVSANNEAIKRSEEPLIPVAAKLLLRSEDSESPQFHNNNNNNNNNSNSNNKASSSGRKRRMSVRRKTVSDVVSAFSVPIQLCENPNRIVQCSGSLSASIRTENDPSAPICDYRHNLLSDMWFIHSDVPKSHTLIASINLREASVTSISSRTFEVSAPGITVSVSHAKPKRLETTIREDIARLRVFGVPLEDLLVVDNDITGVPRVALLCMEFVEKNGFNMEGIFRVAGKPSVMSALQTAFNNRSAEVDFSAVTAYDVAHLFKRFLYDLPEPLLTHEGYKRFMTTQIPQNKADENELQHFIESVRNIIRGIPQAHRELARVIFAFLSVCGDCSPKTKMTPTNLAIVFAPVILRPKSLPISNANVAPVMMDLASVTKANEIVKLMIENHFDIFT